MTTLGQPLAGGSGDAVEFLQLIGVPGTTEASRVPTLSRGASRLAVHWWANSLDEMFGVLSDPAVFASATDAFVPSAQLNAIMTVEQLFRRTTSSQVAHRDANARRVLMFTILDTLERLTNRKLETHCSLTTAKKTLDGIREAVPSEAAMVLLPMAERAVTALERVQSGFFFSRDVADRAHVVLQLADEGEVRISIEKATWMFLKALRDATHGHGSDKPRVAERTSALLAQHDGDIPHDLGLLGYLYLLDVLSHPDRLRTILALHARKTSD